MTRRLTYRVSLGHKTTTISGSINGWHGSITVREDPDDSGSEPSSTYNGTGRPNRLALAIALAEHEDHMAAEFQRPGWGWFNPDNWVF